MEWCAGISIHAPWWSHPELQKHVSLPIRCYCCLLQPPADWQRRWLTNCFRPHEEQPGDLFTNRIFARYEWHVRCFCGKGSYSTMKIKRMVSGLHSPWRRLYQNDHHGRLEDHGLLGDGRPVRDCGIWCASWVLSIFGEKLCEAACQKRTINDEKTYSRFDPSAGTASAMFESSSLGATVDRPMVLSRLRSSPRGAAWGVYPQIMYKVWDVFAGKAVWREW